jgi:hypothetical protein
MMLQEYFFRRALSERRLAASTAAATAATEAATAATEAAVIRIDHSTGECFHGTRRYPVMFPMSMVTQLDAWRRQYGDGDCDGDGSGGARSADGYFFRGLINDRKRWVHDFAACNEQSSVTHSLRGRDPSRKYELDESYYTAMCGAAFVLAPNDVYPWSYRFFEAIMCGAIPVLLASDDDRYADAHGFKYLRYTPPPPPPPVTSSDTSSSPIPPPPPPSSSSSSSSFPPPDHVWRRDWADDNRRILLAHHTFATSASSCPCDAGVVVVDGRDT